MFLDRPISRELKRKSLDRGAPQPTNATPTHKSVSMEHKMDPLAGRLNQTQEEFLGWSSQPNTSATQDEDQARKEDSSSAGRLNRTQDGFLDKTRTKSKSLAETLLDRTTPSLTHKEARWFLDADINKGEKQGLLRTRSAQHTTYRRRHLLCRARG